MLIVSCVLFSDTISGSQLDDKHFNFSKISDYFLLLFLLFSNVRKIR